MFDPHVPSPDPPPSATSATTAGVPGSTDPTDKGKRKRSKFDRHGGGSSAAASDFAEPVAQPGASPPAPRKKKDRYHPGKIAGPCTECGKRFWSWKALFGHMRCHPERQWRGINPPPNLRRSGPGNTSASQPWPAPAPVTSSQTNITAAERDVAHSLMMMAKGESCRGKDVAGEAAAEGAEGLKFKCSSCKRVFGSHHALGGHRATHKNVKGCFAHGIDREEERGEQDVEDEEEEAEEEEEEGIYSKVAVACEKLARERREAEARAIQRVAERLAMELDQHKCNICLKVFPTGQALGGHMRSHSEKGDEPGPSSSSSRRGCMVDLNLPPPAETETRDDSPTEHPVLDLRLGM